ncbi:NB-ARC domain-containing protein [Streptomyces sp. 058-1L]|uniref:NB-ARC domain-containing protein n=1 Tax=Streptomyces sp. 058-1L TaxID=2789266 RepID=UPI0039818780
MDGGRVAARGFQYQYLRTLEALLAALDREEVSGCRIEGPVQSAAAPAVDVVDFDLVDERGDCLLAAQVKSAAPGRRISAPDAFVILAAMIAKCDAVAYELITAAIPDARCSTLSRALAKPDQTVEDLQSAVAEVLKQAPKAQALLRTLSEDEVRRLGRCRIVFDARDESAIRRDLHDQLRLRRTRHRAGLGERSAGLVLGHLTSEVLRRAATPQEAYWRTADFAAAIMVEDDALIRALGRKDWGVVYGPVAPVPDVVRPALLADVAAGLPPTCSRDEGVRCCVVTGLSGIGKSSTAAAFIAEHADQYDLVFWADASTAESLSASFRRLWGHLHGQRDDSLASANSVYLQEQVHALLSSLPGRWLIVFDDASANTVTPWIPRLGHGDILITSIDEAGWTWAERRVAVDRMSADQAYTLFTRRLGLNSQDTEQHRDSLVSLAEALQGWPLAIELACGYLRSCGIPVDRVGQYRAALLSRALDDRFSVPPGYPRTLVAAVDLSLARLTQLLAGQKQLSMQVREVLGYLTNFAPQRIPIHLAALSAFAHPDIMPLDGVHQTAVDEEDIPVREIVRALIQVSFVRYAEPLAPLPGAFPGIDDTVSMNAVLQQILRQHYEQAPGSREALSRSAYHTDRWLFIALEMGQPDRSWDLAQHAAFLAEHAQRRNVKDNNTAILIGNLAGFKKSQGEHQEALELLLLELAWIEEMKEPNEVLLAQTRMHLANSYQLAEMPEEAGQAIRLLSPLLPYVERIRHDESAQNAAAVLSLQSSLIIESVLQRNPEDEGLMDLHRRFTALSQELPTPSRVTEIAEARQVGRLMEERRLEEAERAAREVLASSTSVSTPTSVEVHRLLVEALAAQMRWQDAEAEFERFLHHTGPRSLHRLSEQLLVHNVGLACALGWVIAGEQAAVTLLNRIVTDIDVESLAQQVSLVDRTRYTLLKAVAAAGRNDIETTLELVQIIGTNPLHKTAEDSAAWEQLFTRLFLRINTLVSTTIHADHQKQGEDLLQALPTGWEQHPDVARIFSQATVDIKLGMSTQPPFTVISFAHHAMLGIEGAEKPFALAIMQPTHMLAIDVEAHGALELQVHQMCSSGFRLVHFEALSVPTPAGWRLRHRSGQLILQDATGTTRARSRTKLSPQWAAAADGHQRVLVLYGFGFDLADPAKQHEAFASPQAFVDCLSKAAENRLLSVALVHWKASSPGGKKRRKGHRKTSR